MTHKKAGLLCVTKKFDTNTHQMLQGDHSAALLDNVQSYKLFMGKTLISYTPKP